MATQQQRSQSTRAQLLKAFRASFLKNGFEKTTTQQVLNQIGLSKGAMYHHFRSKIDIAEALYEEESRRTITSAVESVDPKAPPLDQLKGACLAWTQKVRAPRVSKILFEIGPAALGAQKAKEIEDAVSLKLIEDILRDAIERGDINTSDPKLIATFLNALVAEAAFHAIRTGKDTTHHLSQAIDGLLNGFRL